jgi:hypothetical protein
LRASLQEWLYFLSINETTVQTEMSQQSLIAIKHVAESQGLRSPANGAPAYGSFIQALLVLGF